MSFVGDIVITSMEACRILLVFTRILNLSYFTCFTAVILVWDDLPLNFRSFCPVSGHQKNMFPTWEHWRLVSRKLVLRSSFWSNLKRRHSG